MSEAGVPAACIYSVPEICKHPHILHREILAPIYKIPGTDKIATVATRGYKLAGEKTISTTPPPVLGQNTEEILKSIGLTDKDIRTLRTDGTI